MSEVVIYEDGNVTVEWELKLKMKKLEVCANFAHTTQHGTISKSPEIMSLIKNQPFLLWNKLTGLENHYDVKSVDAIFATTDNNEIMNMLYGEGE